MASHKDKDYRKKSLNFHLVDTVCSEKQDPGKVQLGRIIVCKVLFLFILYFEVKEK